MIGLTFAFGITLLLGALFSPIAVEAEQSAKPARIGYLATDLAGGDPRNRDAFLQGLRDLGYVESRNSDRVPGAKEARAVPALAPSVALKVDVHRNFGGTRGALAPGKRPGPSHCLSAVGDPVRTGSSLLGRGRQCHGALPGLHELVGKWLELPQSGRPGINRVALLLKPDAVLRRQKRFLRSDSAAGRLECGFKSLRREVPQISQGLLGHVRARACARLAGNPVFASARRSSWSGGKKPATDDVGFRTSRGRGPMSYALTC